MRVGFVSHSAELAGAERYLLDALRLLGGTGVEACVVLPRPGPLEAKLAALKVPCAVVPYHWWAVRYPKARLTRVVRNLVSYRAVSRVAQFLSAQGCELVFSNSETVFVGALAARRLDRPHVWQLHEIREFWDYDLGDAWSSRFMRRSTQGFIANSIATRDSYRPYLGEAEIPVVYQAVESDELPPAIPRAAGADFRCVRIATIGTHKRQHEAVEAVRQLRGAGMPVALDLIGEVAEGAEDYEQELRREASRGVLEGAVRFLGFVDQPAQHVAAAQVVLQTSREPFGRTVIEAMAAGTPIIASNAGAASELITHGETGWLYEHGNAASLADGIRRLSEDPELAGRLARAGRELVTVKFSPTAFRDGLMAALETALTEFSRGRA
jgi:glycosyltransferase involved in cell wall biosynthesis